MMKFRQEKKEQISKAHHLHPCITYCEDVQVTVIESWVSGGLYKTITKTAETGYIEEGDLLVNC